MISCFLYFFLADESFSFLLQVGAVGLGKLNSRVALPDSENAKRNLATCQSKIDIARKPIFTVYGRMAEWSKACGSGPHLSGGAGSDVF
jgi:hypothetical protein